MAKVVLVRGSALEPKEFPEEPDNRAKNRAYALADLHNTNKVYYANVGYSIWTVDASDYYRKREATS